MHCFLSVNSTAIDPWVKAGHKRRQFQSYFIYKYADTCILFYLYVYTHTCLIQAMLFIQLKKLIQSWI